LRHNRNHFRYWGSCGYLLRGKAEAMVCASETATGYQRSMSADEMNRLIRRGLVAIVATKVMDGKLDEEFEVY